MVNMRLYRYLYISALAAALAVAQGKPRARAVGVRLEGTPGPLNAITDVTGVEVGHTTLISGDSVRTGVTAVWPRGKASGDPVFGGFFSQNGNGDMTGTHWLDESGFLDGPVLITNTHSVGVVRDAFLAWLVKNKRQPGHQRLSRRLLHLSDRGRDLRRLSERHQRLSREAGARGCGARWRERRRGGRRQRRRRDRNDRATDSRAGSARRHGACRAGTRWACWCSAIAEASASFASADLPVGEEIVSPPVASAGLSVSRGHRLDHYRRGDRRAAAAASDQTARAARDDGTRAHRRDFRKWLGRYLHCVLDREIRGSRRRPGTSRVTPNEALNPIFEGVVQATEEAILNAMFAAETMTGVAGSSRHGAVA